jgi:signal transduction histidine kinase
MTGLTPLDDHRDDRQSVRSAPAATRMRAIHLRASIAPPSVIAVLGVGIITFIVVRGLPAATLRLAIAGTAVGVVATLLTAVYAASAAARQVYDQIETVRSLIGQGQNELQQQVRRILARQQPVPRIAAPSRGMDTDPFRQLTRDVERAQYIAEQAVLRLAAQVPAGTADQRVEIFVNLARRMQSLVHREIELIDELEAKVEDPDLLKGLFTVDHLATRMRRQSESLAVLGGATSRRQWTRQVTMHEVLRAAVAEVEQYSRVKVVPPVEGVLTGSAVADVIHLIAELIENATKFSPPHAPALLRAQRVTAGIAIEVEDRGLGMVPADRDQMNSLLTDPTRVDVNELLRDGRLGLFVVSSLARRHAIKIQLQANIYGGIQAVVVIPNGLIDGRDGARQIQGPEYQARTEPEPAVAIGASVPAVSPPALASPPASRPSPPARQATPPTRWDDGQANVTAPAPPAGPAPAAPAPAAPAPAAPAPAAGFPEPHTALPGDRPPLPKRKVQAHMAPELRDEPETRREEPPAEQMTSLMADFQRGISRSGEEDPATRD